VSGCLFHFRQSLYRKLKELGMSRPYKNDIDFRNFNLLCGSQEFAALAITYPNVIQLVTHIDGTYFRGRFPPSVWNMYNRSRMTLIVIIDPGNNGPQE
jgi:hypothetical protein